MQHLKEVIFVTPVLYGNHNFPLVIREKIIKYNRGAPIHQDEAPQICKQLAPGMVIELPEDDIQRYIEIFLSWLRIPDDGTLVRKLRQACEKPSLRLECIRSGSIDLLSSPFFMGLDQ